MFNTQLGSTKNTISVHLNSNNSSFEQWFLLMSDAHWDNPKCNRKLLKRHFDQAVERKAGILSFGDFFCLMQGKGDPRHNKDGIRPEHNNEHYMNSVVNTAAEWLEPYRENIIMMADGNHETGVKKHHEIDVTDWLTRLVRVPRMGYSGFVNFRFRRTTEGRKRAGFTYALYFHHGAGGGGVMTKGTLSVVRTAAWVPDAHFVVGGHIHQQWMMPIARLRQTQKGVEYLDEQIHIRCPTYKQEFDLRGGFHVERGREPRPLGGWWLRFFYDRSEDSRARVNYELTRAK